MEIILQSDDGGVVRLAAAGKITQSYTLAVGDPLEAAAGKGVYQRKVLLDMRRVESLDSSGVNWLLQRRTRFRQDGGRIVLHSLPPLVANTLRLLRMQLVLEIADDERAALARLDGEPS